MKCKCFICKDSEVRFLLKKDGYDIWSCMDCGLNFVWPQPSDKELKRLYSLKGGYSHSDKGFDLDVVSRDYEKRIGFFVKNGAKRVLDVGCASGSFVWHCKRRGLECVGIDLDPDSIKFGIGKGLDLREGRLEDFGFGEGEFDGVNLGDILEHVKDPEGFLRRCLMVLKKGGVLIISTPNTNSFFPKATRWVYEKTGIMWSHPTPPYHLFDFSDENIVLLLNKVGLDLLGIKYSKTSLFYSIYHTGYFDDLRKSIKGTSSSHIFVGILRNINFGIFKQSIVTFIYTSIFILDKALTKKGGMNVFVKK